MNGCCGKTCPERSVLEKLKGQTLDTFLDQWSKGMFLSLRTDGETQEFASPKEVTGLSNGVCLTLNTSESPNDAVESSLYSVLEHGGGTRRYCLSPKACEGILRRAKERGKVLPKTLEETLEKMTSVPNGGGYKVTGALCAVDRKGIGNQYVDQGKVVMEPCMISEDTFAVSQENHMDIATNVAPPLKSRDYKAPHAVCYEEPTIYDMKQHHAPEESDSVQLTTGNCKGVRGDTPLVMDVVSWKERDRLAQIRNNLTDPITATDYKGPSFVGYMEKMEDGHDS